MFYTLESTYDALIHMFFGNHYSESWFEPWNYQWYTGFTVMSYPPLVHQSIGFLSLIGGLKFGMFTVAIIGVVLFITGVFRYSYLITSNKKVAGYASILAAFSSSFVETLHVFGQLPSIIGISVLMHALPEIYKWLRTGRLLFLATSLSLIAVTVTSHHVTPIFGMIFFIFPLIGMAILDQAKEKIGAYGNIKVKHFFIYLWKLLPRIIGFGFFALDIIILCILPYWINSKKNPISQVPIPHGSRDSFIEVGSSGLAFFLIPWGVLLIILPYFFYRFYSKRLIFFGLSFTLLFILGTGGTTPIPRMMLGETAFNILTLDRFTLWASIMALPMFGEFVYRFSEGDLKEFVDRKLGAPYHRMLAGMMAGLMLIVTIFTLSLNYFRPGQPAKINMLPIVNFLHQDQHDHWRYLTLGFGDQIAWLASQSGALSVDGNYHSARRLPELTTRAVERLENSKFRGVEGLGSLQQFLTVPEKYNLKYVFSNDKFYDPMLYFCGWQRLSQLENGINVWEKLNVKPLSSILPIEDVDRWQKILWGIMPFTTVFLALFINIYALRRRKRKPWLDLVEEIAEKKDKDKPFPKLLFSLQHIWGYLLAVIIIASIYMIYIFNQSQSSPTKAVIAYFDHLDFKQFEAAHQMIDPEEELNIDQFMLEISVSDGLVNSYGKLDELRTSILEESDSLAIISVEGDWISPLKNIQRSFTKTLVQRNGKWFIKHVKTEADLPPDQLYRKPSILYHSQGRRKISTEQSYHEDVLKQPVLEILSARLVKKEGEYALIGEVQNIDNVPADVVLTGTIYDKNNKNLATYNSMYHLKHKLMPKETSSFKIEFQGVAWINNGDKIPEKFNPEEFTPVYFENDPIKFNLQAAGNVSSHDLYKDLALSALSTTDGILKGSIFNGGIEEVTVPQLILSYYDEAKELIWVDYEFIKDGVRQQRTRNFSVPLEDKMSVKVISEDLSNCFVNGLPNEAISRKVIPKRKIHQPEELLQNIHLNGAKYLKIELNNFIGNPK